MDFTNRINRVSVSLTIGMAKKARELKQQGKDVIGLSLGEPDFDTPDHIKSAAIAAINRGETKYPPVTGILPLKEAIVNKFKRDYDLYFALNQVMVSTGAKQCLMNIILSLVQEGDEVVIPLPYWVSYSEMVKFAGGKCVFVPSKFEQGFTLDLDALEASITTKTKVLIFSSPSNPAGSVLSKEQLKKVAEIVAKNPQMVIVSDEIYEHINFEGQHISISQFKEIRDQLVIINGVSKGFAMTGWRLGYMVGPVNIVAACDKLQGQFTSGANHIAQWAAVEALTGDMKPTQEMVQTFKTRRDLMVSLLSEIPGLEIDRPKGAFYLFPRISNFLGKTIQGVEIKDSMDFCSVILDHALVSLVPGVAFGMDDHVRISYASSEKDLREAVKRIKEVLA